MDRSPPSFLLPLIVYSFLDFSFVDCTACIRLSLVGPLMFLLSVQATSMHGSAKSYLLTLFAKAARLVLQPSPVVFLACRSETWYLMRQAIAVFLSTTTRTHFDTSSNLSARAVVDSACRGTNFASDVWHRQELRIRSHKGGTECREIYLY